MRNKLISILLVLLALAAAVVATTAGTLIWPKYTRAYQHEEAAGPEAEDADSGVFSSHLPLVLIETGGVEITENEKKPVSVAVVDNEGGHNHPADAPAMETAALINIRGTTSAIFPKKQYRLTFVAGLDSTEKVRRGVMGMPAESDWILNAPYLDKTLMRNYMVYNLAGEIMAWSPNVRFCELFLDGEYEGLYLMIEAIAVGDHRVNVARNTASSAETGYLLLQERDGYTKTPLKDYCALNRLTYYGIGVEYPGAVSLTDAQKAYILGSINSFEEKLYSLGEPGVGRAYADEINLESFVDYYIINEFTLNRDAGLYSTYCYRDPRGKLTMGPVWDFNNCFDNHFDPTPTDRLVVAGNNWFLQLTQDRVFVDTVLWRYGELRKTVLADDRLLRMIDEITAYLGPAIGRNNRRWPEMYTTGQLWPAEDGTDRDLYSYEEAIGQLKSSIVARGRFLDENLAGLLRNPAPTATPKIVQLP